MNETVKRLAWVGASLVLSTALLILLGGLIVGGTAYMATRDEPQVDAQPVAAPRRVTLQPGEARRADGAIREKMLRRLVVRWDAVGFNLNQVDRGCVAGHESEIAEAVRSIDTILNTTVPELRKRVPGMATTKLVVRAEVTGEADGNSPISEKSDTCARHRAAVAALPTERPPGVKWHVDPLVDGANCNQAFALRRAGVCAEEVASKFELLQFDVERGTFGMDMFIHGHVNPERGGSFRGARVAIYAELQVPERALTELEAAVVASGGLVDS